MKRSVLIGMNRIRAAYLELAPDLDRYLVMSAHDDPAGMRITMGVPPGTGTLFWIGHILSGTPTVVMILNSVLAGVIATVAAVRVGAVAWVDLRGGCGGLHRRRGAR